MPPPPDMRLSDNVLLTTHGDGEIVTADVIRRTTLFGRFQKIVKGFDVRFGGKDPKARRLSGGNLQKIVIGAKCCATRPHRRRPADLGVDAAAAGFIRTTLRERAAQGCAVLVVSPGPRRIAGIHRPHRGDERGRLTAPVPVKKPRARRSASPWAALMARMMPTRRGRATMPLRLERQENISPLRHALAPVVALLVTLVVGAFMFVVLGHDPVRAFAIYFIDPLGDPYTLQELVVKAAPLLLIGVGLAFCYRANR